MNHSRLLIYYAEIIHSSFFCSTGTKTYIHHFSVSSFWAHLHSLQLQGPPKLKQGLLEKWAEYSTDSHHLLTPRILQPNRSKISRKRQYITINYTPPPFSMRPTARIEVHFLGLFVILSSCSIYLKTSYEKEIMHLSVENNEGKFQQAVIYQIQASFLLGKFTSGHLYMQVCRCTHSDLKVEIG